MTKFVDTVLEGLMMETTYSNTEPVMDLGMCDMCDPAEDDEINRSMVGVDDVSGENIDAKLIRAARQEEMARLQKAQGLHLRATGRRGERHGWQFHRRAMGESE